MIAKECNYGFKSTLIYAVVAFFFSAYSYSNAQGGINHNRTIEYLTSAASTISNWTSPEGFTYDYHSTYEVINAYNSLGITSQEGTNALAWMNAQPQVSIDHVARRVALNGAASSEADINYLMDSLRESALQYDYPDAKPGLLDPALTLLALKHAGVTNHVEINIAFNYLARNQNPDGGWGVYPGDRSSVYMTTVVMETLTTYLVREPVPAARAFLMTKNNADGGFGDDSSSVWEKALAYLSLAHRMGFEAEGMVTGCNA